MVMMMIIIITRGDIIKERKTEERRKGPQKGKEGQEVRKNNLEITSIF